MTRSRAGRFALAALGGVLEALALPLVVPGLGLRQVDPGRAGVGSAGWGSFRPSSRWAPPPDRGRPRCSGSPRARPPSTPPSTG